MKLQFPPGFGFGCATSAVQIEGAWNEEGKGESNWDRWCHTPGRIKGGGMADVAVDHYHRWQEDVALMQSLGLNAYRLSFSWSRVIPDGTGAFNPAGVAFYDRLIDGLLKVGIEPYVTLCHYDIPQALEDRGGWVNREMTDWFASYANRMSRHFGDRVTKWVTINEPICISDDHYGGTVEPPGIGDPQARSTVTHHLLLGHGKALAAIKAAGGNRLQVGLVCNLYPVHPSLSLLHNLDSAGARVNFTTGSEASSYDNFSLEEGFEAVRLMENRVNRRWLDPIYKSQYPDGLWENLGYTPEIRTGDMQIIGARPDFLGVNYYSRILTRPVRRNGAIDCAWVSPAEAGIPVTTMGWEIYPQGLSELLIHLKQEYNSPVFYLTENGIATDDQVASDGKIYDDYRIEFLRAHLDQVQICLDRGIDLRGYFVWTLMDNFEWEAGWSQRFGIVYVDHATLKRTPKESAYWYRDYIRSVKR